ncbi:hypothetical protein MIB92_13145 [Aestuariirhabdus sp. Z084]|uniref:hypothetical protein n=1 Tax=Aestuariirhabdus haliotis TaxID=2918751 RepID=UPI00201B35B0|nr:hypothetical protein [Aestuariirhabdus haliotis]MCL6416599.1 hypothetical protein [Aestuariirhabdus haliotis]MCL6420634.1 hypothetical protein [Aestuariirhabdus haliotis]
MASQLAVCKDLSKLHKQLTALVIFLFIGQPVVLGLSSSEMVLLSATLLISSVSFSSGQSNILVGTTHLLLFFAYVILMFG